MKAIVFDRCGEPAEVLEVRELPVPTPARGQVRVRMLASPVNPSDLLFVRGQYGSAPRLPATPGFEGVGVVEESGGGFLGWRVKGRRVAVLNGVTGNWQDQCVVPASQVVPVPDDLPDEEVASFFVNPATAWVMVKEVLRVPRGAWLLQTAAGSSLGRMIIRLCKQEGIRTLNVVRRPEQAAELRREGGDAAVSTNTEALVERVREISGDAGVRHAIDAVGGTTGSEALAALSREGRLLVYGALSGEPYTIDPRAILVGQKTMEGFWLKEWIERQGLLKKLMLVRRLVRLLRSGVLTTTVGATFSLDQAAEAVRAAEEVGRPGKIMFRIGTR
jgi:NADPH:quinone reductase-like Zn-dependent oxidoreductase